MAQQAVDSITASRSPRSAPRAGPILGMRGGLGKTLLIAFLLLTIVPLSLLGFLTYNQIQQDTRERLVASLESMVALKEAHLVDRVESYQRALSLLANAFGPGSDPAAQLAAIQANDPALSALILMDLDTGDVLATGGSPWVDAHALQSLATEEPGLVVLPPLAGSDRPILAITHAWENRLLVAELDWEAPRQIVMAFDDPGEEGGSYLVTEEGWVLTEEGLTQLSRDDREDFGEGVANVLQGKSGSGAYDGPDGTPVFGAYRWNPELRVGILAEQMQLQALATGNAMTAMVVGATLAVALVTSAIAAAVTRRVTRPIVQLTETAAWMARGDLDQKVSVTRKDEIGVLAQAFNRMAAELRVLYGDLEAKVAERTRQLEEANERTHYYLMQLVTSAEVARVVSSIRDLDELLTTVVGLIGRTFELHHTAVYLLDDSGEWVVWRVGSRGSDLSLERVEVGSPTLVGRVAADGHLRVVRSGHSAEQGTDPGIAETLRLPVVCEMVLPLQVQERMLGVLDLQSSRADDFGENERVVYQGLADQISIAIENARAYAVERETVEKFRELDRVQSQFLTNMSHALRTPLNSIIGFSRLLLKEVDGPLNEMQHADLTAVYESGRQLFGLINDMLELSRLELGVAPFSRSKVDLAEIIEGVMATARALARGRPVRLYEHIPEDLPALHTDGQRIRQVILALLSNAVKLTDRGSIHLRVTTDDGHVIISVQDTGMGIPRGGREQIFSDAGYGEPDSDRDVPGFGLAISKRVVERLGGEIWVQSEEGVGSTFTFTLPIRPEVEAGLG
jgi:signal transduction histidine kinase